MAASQRMAEAQAKPKHVFTSLAHTLPGIPSMLHRDQGSDADRRWPINFCTWGQRNGERDKSSVLGGLNGVGLHHASQAGESQRLDRDSRIFPSALTVVTRLLHTLSYD